METIKYRDLDVNVKVHQKILSTGYDSQEDDSWVEVISVEYNGEDITHLLTPIYLDALNRNKANYDDWNEIDQYLYNYGEPLITIQRNINETYDDL